MNIKYNGWKLNDVVLELNLPRKPTRLKIVLMFKRIKQAKVFRMFQTWYSLKNELDIQKVLTGKLLIEINKNRVNEIINDIHEAEFQVFSQWGDDGIIQFLISYLDIDSKTFVEFGIEDYRESNTRFLLTNNNWRGLVIDSSKKNIRQLQGEDIYWRYDLTALTEHVTKENINSILKSNGFINEIGLLHIDIDGNDYWIWKEINIISPVIVIVEYNSVFGCENTWTVPYDPGFSRQGYHYSNLCFGASLLALCDLAEEKGYYFIGCNNNGVNAYFIRKDKIKELRPLTAREGYVLSKFRESRDKNSNLSFVSGANRLQQIKGVKVFNTRLCIVESI